MIVAIDGPAGAGKSTVAKALAQRLGFTYINTGAMYRAIGWKVLQEKIALEDLEKISKIANDSLIELIGDTVWMDGEEITNQIRSAEISSAASVVSAIPAVRRALVAQQQRLGLATNVVMEGRDIGTKVFPDAEVKIYLDASPKTRAERRHREEIEKGIEASFQKILAEIIERDTRDTTREDSPLTQATGSIYFDSSNFTPHEVIEQLTQFVTAKQ
jgi:CMP/dCMP kinase